MFHSAKTDIKNSDMTRKDVGQKFRNVPTFGETVKNGVFVSASASEGSNSSNNAGGTGRKGKWPNERRND
jgi:hypothetical protein